MSPASWLKLPLKRVAEVMPSNVDKHTVEGELPVRLCNYVDVYSNDRIDDSIDFMPATASEAQIARFTLKKQDVLVTKDSEEPSDIGIPAYVPRDMPGVVCGYHLAVLRPDLMRVHGAFLHWALQSTEVQAYYETAATGISRYALGINDLGMTPLHLPDRPTQARIANFLDEQTARIDALIAEKERLVGTLKNLRAEAIDHTVLGGEIKVRGQPLNGLDVLGGAPRGWDVSRMKYELDYVTSGSRGWADYYADDGAIFIRIGNLTRDSITLDLADVQRVVLPDAAEGVRTRVRPGDLLISITAYLGSVAVAPREIEEAYVSQHVSLARPNFVRAIPDWLGYVVLSCVGKTFFDLQAYGGTKIQLSLDDIREMPVPLPSLGEQKRRIVRLEWRLARLAHLEKHVAEHITILREYRASLISAAVTGQLDIDNFKRGVA